uniref:Regulatory protein zeste n=1 Tax=Heliothis virescens TaxID=7102 RepID=A0A2A4JD93_HELVI
MNEAKKRAWVEITKKFNSICRRNKRTAQQIRIQWKTMKMLMKKQTRAEDLIIEGPGLEILNSETEKISNNSGLNFKCLKVESIEYETESEEDADPLLVSSPVSETITPTPIQKESSNIQVELEVLSGCNESSTQTDHDYTARPNKNGDTSNISEKHYEDMRYYRDMENNRLEKEHLLRMRTMQEQHNQLMKNLRLQEEILKKQLSKID